MLPGMMMHRPLNILQVLDYAAEIHPRREIVSVTLEGGLHRIGYRDVRGRVAKLANALVRLGLAPGDRVATIAWNGYRHFELYYATAGMGAVCHTINPRLAPEQLVYILRHAADRALFFDITFAPLVDAILPHLAPAPILVAMTDREHMPQMQAADVRCYEDLVAAEPDSFDWLEVDENAACALCYTSGTTGVPKAALYSHRSTMLHALATPLSGQAAFQQGNKILPVVPLFHVNAWGLPYSAPLAGVSLVMPGARLDGASLFDLLEAEEVFSTWGVPTVWLGLLAEMNKRGRKPNGLVEVVIGGSAAPKSMIEAFESGFGVEVIHGWGMTEMSPIGTIGCLSPEHRRLPLAERIALKGKQGRRLFGVDLKIVDDAGRLLPHDGRATGHLYVRGNTIVSGYYNNPEASRAALDAEGWFATGDVAAIDPDGFLMITDRAKDLIKSGGEWISSIALENVAMAHPAIANCAVIARPDLKWDERPLLIAVKAPGAACAKEDILAFMADRIPRWQLPDDVVFVDALPMTATGKVSKRLLRDRFAATASEGSAAGDPPPNAATP